jgi:DNA (cytosine-5)-methyltransferase 1
MGWEPIAFSEIEPFPCAVLAHHYPTVPNWGDMTQFKEWQNESIELLVGGTPCQSFSVAGLRKGLDDPRGNLALTYLAIADKYRPEWLVWENVPGVLSSKGGTDFATFLGALGELGYGFAYRILDAQFFGVAQRRRRVFVVANSRDWRRAAAVLFERESLSGNPAPRRKKGKETSGTFTARTNISRNKPEHLVPEVVGTLSDGAHMGGGLNGQDAYTGRVIPVINNIRNFGEPVPYDFFQITAPVNSQNRSPGDPCHTLARDNAAHATIMQSVVAVQGTLIGRDENSGPNGSGADETGSMFTLTKTDVHGVAYSCSDIAPTMGSSGPPYSRTGNERVESNALAIENMQVRRLTCTECERLQGFPDGYTNVPYRNKPASDGPRYRALGNSMAVPVMRWIGNRIQMLTEALNEHR